MASSITFDFISRGGPALAADFKRTGDNAAAAARGAKVLSGVIKDLGEKENRTAAESATLAKALRLTGDAEDRAAAKALAADIAIRRLDDALKDSGKNAGGARSGIAGLAGELTGFGAAASAANSGGNKFQLALAGLTLASGVLEPALAGVVVAAGGLAAGLASAGAGLGVFGLVAQSVFAEASKAATAYGTAQAKYASATTSKQRATALQAEKAAYQGLSAPVKTLAVELGNVKNEWKKFTDAAAPGVVGVISKGLGLLPKILSAMQPFLAPVEKALSGIIGQLNTGLSSSGFKSFIGAFAANSGPAITKLAVAIGNVVVGIGGILKAFLPTSQQMLSGIDKITAKFREWGTTLSSHSGFQSLMATFRSETPQAVAILRNLGDVLGNVGKAMFGLSSFSNSRLLLSALLPLSGVMASLSKNTDLVRVALYALAAVKIGQQFSWVGPAWQGLVKFAAAADGATIAQTIAAAATRAWGLAMDALPWVALAAAVVAVAILVIKYHTQIWNFMKRVWHDILAVIMAAWGWVKANWPLLLAIITGPVGLAILWIAKNFGKITAAVKTVLGAVSTAWNATWNALKTAFRTFVVVGILGPLGLIVHGAAAAFGWVPGLGSKLQGAAKAFDTFKANVNAALGGINNKTVSVSVAMTSKTNPYPGGISGRAAAGMYVSQGTGPTADDVLIRASRGELIVPANMVRAGAVDHLRGAIPGFAGGGVVVSAHTPSAAAVESTLMASVMTLAQAFAKAAQAAQAAAGSSVPAQGGGAARWKNQILTALGMLNQPGSLLGAVEHRMNQESGGQQFAVNKWDSNWAAGTPSVGVMQVIGPTYASNSPPGWRNLPPMAYGVSEDVLANTYAGLHHAITAYPGRSLASVMMQSGGYAEGGVVPGYASGGVAGQGAAWLKAWRDKRGGGFGAAWGPVVVNEQIAEMTAAAKRAKTLAAAKGLTPRQHRYWAATAADETRRLGVLNRERAVERAWRGQLGASDVTLAAEIAAAGKSPGLAGPVKGWKTQIARQKATIAGISKMLGYSDAQKAAMAKANPPAKKPPAGPPVPAITHTYGQVTDVIEAFLQSVAAPLGAARGGLVFDRGGTLAPGFNPVWNMTGRPESLVPARGGGGVHLHLTVNGPVGSQQQLEDWFTRTANKMAQHGRLTQAVRAATR